MTLEIPIYQVDAFASRPFTGNPAAVCPLEQWLPDEQLQAIAMENNLAETAFFVPDNGVYHLRWFTPAVEVDLCGHATLASAWVILNELDRGGSAVRFESRSGELRVQRERDLYTLDFPSRPPAACPEVHPALEEALGRKPQEVLCARDYLCVYRSESEIKELAPKFELLAQVDRFAVIVTAPGDSSDFVSRFFAPAKGVPEDPVTGSAHCTLTPYWSERLKKKSLHARQLSPRGGELWLEDRGGRVAISGRASPFLKGTIYLD